jgi:phosphoribosyl 1,2-cyclic phosphodiesterase
MHVSVLGSGSGGNATLVTSGSTTLLVDAGFSARDLATRLGTLGVEPEAVDAIVITHDHADHTRGMGVFARRHGTPVYLTEGTRARCATLLRGEEKTLGYRPGHAFQVGDFRVEPGLALIEAESGLRLGIATDLGRPTAQIRHALAGSDFLILEANHDEGLLHQGPYPWSVKSRIASSHGHLSNLAAARLATDLLHPRLAGIVLAHLSHECNRPELARSVVGGALHRAGYRGFLEVATQEQPTDLFDVADLGRRAGPVQLSFL